MSAVVAAVVAIVGRPNVGKSTLWNRLCRSHEAIVKDQPGVTRDRIYGEASWLGKRFAVIDTGGFEPESEDEIYVAMRQQAELAIDEADAIVHLLDAKDGLLPADREIARLLARSRKPVFHAVNKVDGPAQEIAAAEFWELGVEALYPLSAQHGPGVLDLVEALVPALAAAEDEDEERAEDPAETRIAVVGKPNAGKSTLVNRLLGEERLLVSDVPGTTRDAIDTRLELPPDPARIAAAEEAVRALGGHVDVYGDVDVHEDVLASHAHAHGDVDVHEDVDVYVDEDVDVDVHGDVNVDVHGDGDGDVHEDVDVSGGLVDIEDEAWAPPEDEGTELALREAEEELARARLPRRYLVIDTAGIRRRKWVDTHVEKLSIVKAFKAIDRAEVCLLVIDALHGVTEQDAKLAGLVQDKGRASVLLVNKWDAVPEKDTWTAGEHVKTLREALKFCAWAPIVFISAKTGQRVHKILETVDRVRRNHRRRIPTGDLNRWLAGVVRRTQPPISKNRRLKIYYVSQVATAPPTFVLWVNDPEALHFSYERFLQNQLREAWDFEGTPIRLLPRRKGPKPKRGRRR